MTKRRDSDKDISDKLNKLIWESEKKARKAVTDASKTYEGILKMNTPVSDKQTHSDHARDVTKISNFQRNEAYPKKEVGYQMGKSRKESGWYIHFPDVGTKVKGKVGQPPQHFLRKSHEQAKGPVLAIYYKAMEDVFDVK
ncbi:Phage capsid and scaffold [Staphylococcus equorum subsp. equorum]|uniref:HK97-gp10 family putative phage morphogenesis protein n=1 Tax=Staphylococcus equorum TaxID=246432 RepID=UPI000623BFE8|nr:HK97-gp10 family putative phage morphogenesis protein [Staphylococcus equorum]KKI52954.1 Phage capsid and scaffold [Staphylococcus equorum subsp. equorum]